MGLKVENVSKVYLNGFKAISDISFQVQPSQVFGLIGPNGAGKTTIIKVLKGILKPTSGTFSIENVKFNYSTNNAPIKRLTGYLAEDSIILPFLTIIEYLEVISILYEVPKQKAKDRIERLIRLFGLDERKNDQLNMLSEGMRQKVQWIATLVHDAPFILLDDPLRSLDVRSFQLVVGLINRLKELNKSILLATHYLALVENTCDKVAFLQEGQIVITGTIKNICRATNTSSIYEAYLQVYPNPSAEEDIKQIEF